jgi:leucyl-tRNA synthetase
MYIGGNEHAVLHLLYSRFVTMVLHDQGMLHFEEPFRRFRAHGLIVKDGSKMSKSKGNVVVPDQIIAEWGADTLRLFLMFLGPFEEGGDFRDAGLAGPRRFLERLWDLVDQCERRTLSGEELHRDIVVKWNATKKKVTHDLETLNYNTAIAAMMELLNAMRETNCAERSMVKDMILMVAPFAPHFGEECWERMGGQGSVFDAAWPGWDEKLTLDSVIDVVVQVNGKTRATVRVPRGAAESAVLERAKREDTVKRFVDGKDVRKVVFVKDRLINIVVG